MILNLKNDSHRFRCTYRRYNSNALDQSFVAGDVIMRTGQYKNTVLVLSGSIKIYREDDDGEFFMYYLKPGQACAISMICASKNEQSQIMAKVVEDVELVMVPLYSWING
jgi:CRP/FNR family transcriptional regulator